MFSAACRAAQRAACAKHGAYAGGTERAEHYIWRTMLTRCNNPASKNYPQYGGRGIHVCERWLSYENFISDMGARPSSDHSLDREKNDSGYGPTNCRWATRSQQQKNKRTTMRYEHGGRVQTPSEWADEFGISRALASWRFKHWGGLSRTATWTVISEHA